MNNFVDPTILFFILGLLAGLARSNLEIPPPISRFLSLYLVMALGLKGGFALSASGLTASVATSLVCALSLAVLTPMLTFSLLRRAVRGFDAAALAAIYGSVSAVTFITAVHYLEANAVPYGGHMAAAMALMETPAILMAVIFAHRLRGQQAAQAGPSTRPHVSLPSGSVSQIVRESVSDGAQLLLLGSMVIGVVSGAQGELAMEPFVAELFKGMLAFFLLDMGLVTARNLRGLHGQRRALLAFAALAPIAHAAIALAVAMMVKLSPGDGALLMVLAASASYIAVPAVLRHAIPEASPSLYFGMSLGITSPLNILVGIPVYVAVAQRMLA